MKAVKFMLIFLLAISLFSPNMWSMEQTLLSIRRFDKRQLTHLSSRYEDFRHNPNLFTKEQFEVIQRENLAPIIHDLILHDHIKLHESEQLISFAQEIQSSNMTFYELEKRVVRYIASGELPFTALRKAIDKEQFHAWKITRYREVREENGSFVRFINQLKLKADDRDKVINTFAVCIDSFNREENRRRMKPTICEPMDKYPTPHSPLRTVYVRENEARKETARTQAYGALMASVAEVAEDRQLDIFERVMMGKCIAEQTLRFFEPSHHPFKALKKIYDMEKKSPAEAFFKKSGVCGNFSGMAYNIAQALGLKNHIFLARDSFHIYLEFRHGKSWYHTHPFNSTTNCDIVRFKNEAK